MCLSCSLQRCSISLTKVFADTSASQRRSSGPGDTSSLKQQVTQSVTSMVSSHPSVFAPLDLIFVGQSNVSTCSDITNTLVGISGETVPEGGNLCIY